MRIHCVFFILFYAFSASSLVCESLLVPLSTFYGSGSQNVSCLLNLHRTCSCRSISVSDLYKDISEHCFGKPRKLVRKAYFYRI